MNHSDRKEFAGVVVTALASEGRDATDVVLEFWWKILKPYRIDEIKRAVLCYASDPDDGVFPIKPASVIRLIVGTRKDKALSLWQRVEAGLHAGGFSLELVGDDATARQVLIDMGGSSRFRMCSERDVPYIGNEFQKRYMESTRLMPIRSLREDAVKRVQPPSLGPRKISDLITVPESRDD